MHILNVNMSLDPVDGGTAERTFQLSRNLAALGAQVSTLCLDKGLTPERRANCGGNLITLQMVNRRFYFPHPRDWTKLFESVKAADVVHLTGNWTLINALVYLAIRVLRKPYLFCPCGALPIIGRSNALKKIYRLLITRPLIKNARKLIAVTLSEVPDFLANGAERDKIICLPNAINPDDYRTTMDGTLSERPFLLFLGRLDYVKGPDLGLSAFIKVAHLYPNVDWVFAGPKGDMTPMLEAQLSQSHLHSRVRFLGMVRGSDKVRLLSQAQLLVIPSRSEAMSIVALEAGICATPVLLTDQCGFDEIEKVGGGLVVAVDADKIADGLIRLLSEPSLLKVKGAALQNFCQLNYTWKVLASKYLSQIQRAAVD